MKQWASLCCAVVLAGLGVTFAGCGGTQSLTSPTAEQSNSAADSPAVIQTPDATPATPQSSSSSSVGSVTLKFKRDDGYTATTRASVWEPIARSAGGAPAHPEDQTVTLDGEVSYDASKDLAVPWQATLTNTTSGFDLEDVDWAVSMHGVAGAGTHAGSGYHVDLAASLNDGWSIAEDDLSWDDAGSFVTGPNGSPIATGVGITTSLVSADGGRSTISGFVIVRGYYSPAHPSGDEGLLAGLALYVTPEDTDLSARWSRPTESPKPGLSLRGRKVGFNGYY